MKNKQTKWKIASAILLVLAIGILMFDIVGDSKVNFNGFEISKDNLKDIENFMNDNQINNIQVVDMENNRILNLNKGDN